MLVLLFIFCLSLFTVSAQEGPVLHEPWGEHFTYQQNEQGEILTVCAVFYNHAIIYLYNRENRSLVLIDSSGAYRKSIFLGSIGRQTYIGDDFVVLNNQAFFLNTIDKNLEIFALENGQLIKSIPYPADRYSHERQRKLRIINKIFSDNKYLILGNSQRLFSFDVHTGARENLEMTVTGKERILLYDGNHLVLRNKNTITYKNRFYPRINNKIPMTGKQYFVMGETLYAVIMDSQGIKIRALKEISGK